MTCVVNESLETKAELCRDVILRTEVCRDYLHYVHVPPRLGRNRPNKFWARMGSRRANMTGLDTCEVALQVSHQAARDIKEN